MALNINGTTGISGVDGSASAPALQGTDSNTGINFASDTVNINTGGIARTTVDSSGNVGVGLTSISNARLRIKGANNSTNTFNDGLMVTSNNETVYKKFSWAGIETNAGLSFHESSSGSLVETVRIQQGGGISFNGDSAAANSLHDYEEGTWTPAFKASNASGNSTTTVHESKYTKIGQMVHVSCYITNTGHHGSGTGGTARITGLPFQNTGNHVAISVGYFLAFLQNQTFVSGTVQPGTSEILLRHTTGNASGTSNMDYSNAIGTSSEIIFDATYETAS